MINHSRKYIILSVGAIGSIIMLEALTNNFNKEEYSFQLNKQPDIPAENFVYSPLPYAGVVAATTSGSGYMVSL